MNRARALRTCLWLGALAIVLLVSAPLAKTMSEWRDAGSTISEAARDGVLPAEVSDAPLTLAEQAVVAAEFNDTWNRNGFPCTSLDAIWIARLLIEVAQGDYIGGGGRSGTTVAYAVTKVLIVPEMRFERSTDRVIQEPLIACQLEHRYTNQQLLRMYLPQAYFGKREYGLHAAAQAYFGKHENELTVDEAARLAALLRAPNQYANNEERWAERAQLIAERMEAREAEGL